MAAMAGGKLTARAAASTKPGRYGDGGGLSRCLGQRGAEMGFPLQFARRVTEMGLGSADAVTLAEARDKALEARRTLAGGRNPIEARRAALSAVAPKADLRRRRGRAHCRQGKRVAQR